MNWKMTYIIPLMAFGWIITPVSGATLDVLKEREALAKAELATIIAEKALKAAQNPIPAPKNTKIKIQTVSYGVEGGKTCPAKDIFIAACRTKSGCNLPVNNKLCGDPNPKPKNVAIIIYKCGDIEKKAKVVEGVEAFLNCP